METATEIVVSISMGPADCNLPGENTHDLHDKPVFSAWDAARSAGGGAPDASRPPPNQRVVPLDAPHPVCSGRIRAERGAMSDRWKRWRCYVDELEDLLRWMSAEIDRAERDSAVQNERSTWPAHQRRARPLELVRRMRDMPFFGELLRAASEHGPGSIPPFGDSSLVEPGGGRIDGATWPVPGQSLRPPLSGERPPRRLVSAERALAQRTRSLVTVLDQMTVPRNASAVIRTAEALGLQELHFVHAHGEFVPQRAVTKRCERWIDLRQSRRAEPVLEELRGRGYRILAADFDAGAVPIDEVQLSARTAIVLGSEQEGVSEEVRSQVDGCFFIPTVGLTAYLNVSVAAAVILATLDRRLRREGLRRPLDPDDLRRIRARWYRGLGGGKPRREAALLKWLHRPPVVATETGHLGGRS
jgi:tRNA (guanosine-2'-O-)-methyltransferase